MAAFSYHHPFLLDQSVVFLPNPTSYNLSSEEPNTAVATTAACLLHDHHPLQGHHGTKVTAHSKSKNLQSPGSSLSMVVDDGSNEQTAMKRKDNNGISLNSARSKDTRKAMRKKQKKSKDDEEKKKMMEEEGAVGYIHVRARRGQATDSHSLAERVRREKISERMRFLQSIVPGCDKVTGKTLVLDQIINYVHSLQNQVEFLSMKIASVNPVLYDFGVGLDAFMLKPYQNMSSSMVLPTMPSVQQCNPTPTGGSNTFTTPNNNFNHHQVLWDVDNQRQRCDNPFALSNNITSSH